MICHRSQFSRNLTLLMAERGWTSTELAERMPVEWSVSFDAARRKIRRYMDNTQSPKLETVELFAKVFRVDPGDLAWWNLGAEE